MGNNLPTDWKIYKLKDLIKLNYGKALLTNKRKGGNVPVYGSNGIVGYHNVCLIEKPTVIIGRKGSVGAVNKSETPSWIIDTAYYAEIIAPKLLDINYFYYYAKTLKIETISQKGVKPGVNRTSYLNFSIQLPEISEQFNIVNKINKLESRIENAISLLEENIKNTEHLMASVMNEIYETSKREVWNNVFIKDAFDLKTGGTPSTTQKDKYYGGNIKWLVSGDINHIEIFDCEGRITEDGMKDSNAKILPVNTVLIALNGQGKTRGTVSMLRTEATCNQSLVGMISKDKNKYDPEYLFYNLKSRYIEIRMMTGLNERRGLNMKLIGNINIPFPAIEKQREIVQYFKYITSNIQSLQSPLKDKLSYLRSLKSSILNSAFKGGL